MSDSVVLVVDFGSQYSLLIAKQIRRLKVYSRLVSLKQTLEELDGDSEKVRKHVIGVVLSGGPDSVTDFNPWDSDILDILKRVKELQMPVLGICYGAQLLANLWGGAEIRSSADSDREYGFTQVNQTKINGNPLYVGIQRHHQVWMSHSDSIVVPKKETSDEKIVVLARSVLQQKIAAFQIRDYQPGAYGFQFHPEVTHTPVGMQLLSNFLFQVAGAQPTWTPGNYLEQIVTRLKRQIPEGEPVLVACSGGVDSTVTFALLQQAVGDQLTGIFIDHGLLRQGEYEQVLEGYRRSDLKVRGIEASERFYQALAGVTDPEAKRKVIGRLFIELFTEIAQAVGAEWLGQGTIYPDVIESLGGIKSHHNVGGLPEKLSLKLVEPLRELFKDEVRALGVELGLDHEILNRHPYPGPGLGIRILGEITPERVALLQAADAIFMEGLKREGLYHGVWQAAVILLDSQAVGVQGDRRTYESVVALRAVQSQNGMTAQVSELPWDFLTRIATQIVNQVPGINRVVYDLTNKPPGTIEWE